MAGKLASAKAFFRRIDGTLRSLSKVLKRVVRTLRFVRAFLATGILIILASIVVAFVQPAWMPLFYAVSMLFLMIPLVMLLVLISLPLQAKSVVRLIDKGYPANARELAIRVAARKLHEESIANEELLVETALNEGKKAAAKYRKRAEALKRQLDAMPDDPAEWYDDEGLAERCIAITAAGTRCKRAARKRHRTCAQHKGQSGTGPASDDR
ncbi:MAG: hypothetical protein ACPGQL_08300 [Thermoplasmatota archaeon]